MSTLRAPPTGSIRELADLWDNNDVTDFEGELVEVTRVFEHHTRGEVPAADTD